MTADPNNNGDSGEGPDTRSYLTYLRTNREFTAEAVRTAIDSLPWPDSRAADIVDVGTGAGGALGPLLDQLSANCGGGVLAIDKDARSIAEAKTQIIDLPDGVEADVRIGDLWDIADDYDLIWASDVVWPASFAEPAQVVQRLSRSLKPGGTLALFTTNYYQSMFLPGHSRLERLIRTASELTWGLPNDGPHHYELLGSWMRASGLHDVAVTSVPITAFASESGAAPYLSQIVWPEMRHAVSARGHAAGMSDVDVARAEALLDPDSDEYVGRDPSMFVMQPTLLWTARA
ncbi:MAG: class I SAM-dependent methyltransferase [Cumulibacter sp.]